jgi:hypothetical protein
MNELIVQVPRFFPGPHWRLKPPSRLVTPPNHRPQRGSNMACTPVILLHPLKLKILKSLQVPQLYATDVSQKRASAAATVKMRCVRFKSILTSIHLDNRCQERTHGVFQLDFACL